MARVAALLLTAIVAWLGLFDPASATVPAVGSTAATYTYDGYHQAAATECTTTERGPPILGDTTVHTFDAVDLLSRGTSACSDGLPTLSGATYDDPSGFALAAYATTTTTEPVGIVDEGASRLDRSRVAAKTADNFLPGLPKSAPKPLGLGSTGRVEPANLTEQLAMTAVRAEPAGAVIPRAVMSDARWPAADGWVKMQQIENGVNIHYVRNTITGAVDDFKFK